MIIAQSVPLGIDRGSPRLFTIEITGIDLTNADLHAQIRLSPDAPGDPVVDLPRVTSGTVPGVRLIAVDNSATLPISWIRLQIPAMATGTDPGQLPPAAELGDDLPLYWDMVVTPNGFTADRWFFGPVTVRASVTNTGTLAPLVDDPLPGADAVAKVIGADLSVTLAGAALIQPLVDRADGSAAAAIDAAAHAETKAQVATDAANTAIQQVNLALPKAGGQMTGPIDMNGQPLRGIPAPDADNVATNRGFVNTAIASVYSALSNFAASITATVNGKLSLTGGNLTGILNLSGNRLEAVGDADSDDDAVSRGYADLRYPKRGEPITTLAETDTAKIMTGDERAQVATRDIAAIRYAYGKPVVQAGVDPNGRVGWAVTTDATFYGKFAIRLSVANGLTWNRRSDGFYELAFGTTEGVLPLGSAGDRIDSRTTLYYGGQQVLRAVVDSAGRAALVITKDGYVRGKLALTQGVSNGLTVARRGDGSTAFAFGTVEGELPLGAAGDVIDNKIQRFHRGRKVARAIVDAAYRVAMAVYVDGSIWTNRLRSPTVAPAEIALDFTDYVISAAPVGSNSQLFAYRKVAGTRSRITAIGNNSGLTKSVDGSKVIYLSDRHGEPLIPYYQVPGEWIERPLMPRRGFVGVGDSLTYGTGSTTPATDAIVAQLGAHYGLPFVNLGRPGAYAAEIAGFVDAVHPLVTANGNQIVSGSNSITLDIPFLSANGGTGSDSQKRIIAGILGTVAKSGGADPDYTGAYTFTPDAGQTLPVACPAGTPAILPFNTNGEKIAIIRIGRNNRNGAAFDSTWSDDAFLRTQQVIAWLKPLVKNFIVLPVPNGNYSTENSGGANGVNPGAGYLALMAHNARLKAAYPDNFVDDRAAIVAAYNPALTQDVTDHANDVPPTSLRFDNIHWTTAGYAISAAAIWAFIDAKGWFSNPLLAPNA